MPRHPATDAAARREAAEHVRTAKDLLSSPNPERFSESRIKRSWELLLEALRLNPCAHGGHALLVAATALRTFHYHFRLPSGAHNPYSVFGLIPEVPTARDLALVEKYYRQASDLLGRAAADPDHPCYPAFFKAARLVEDAISS
nr:unnamed protein product [Digitaria exilis]